MLYFIPTPIGNLKDITIRSLEILSSSEIIFCEDTRVTKHLFKLFTEKYPTFIQEKNRDFISFHHHNSQKVLETLDKTIFDKVVCYVSDAGYPIVSDTGIELLNFAKQNNIKFEVLAGASASIIATVLSGFADRKTLFWGFLPHKGKNRESELNIIINSGYTVTVFESPHRLLKLLKELSEIIPNREIFIVKEISKKFEQKWWDSSKNIFEIFQNQNIKGEWAIVIKGESLKNQSPISKKDIEDLEIQPKIKAKLLSKLTGESIKTVYNRLIS